MLGRFQSGEAASSDRDRRFGQIHLDEIQNQRLVERVIETCRDNLRFGHRSVFKPTEQLANVLRHAHRHPLAYTEANQPSPIALTEPQMSALLAASHPLPPAARAAFLEHCAREIANLPELGDGVLHRSDTTEHRSLADSRGFRSRIGAGRPGHHFRAILETSVALSGGGE
jgi:hypothetical protein